MTGPDTTPFDPSIAFVDHLLAHRRLGKAPRTELEWVAAHATLRHYEHGSAMLLAGQQADSLHVILRGGFVLRTDRAVGSQIIYEFVAGEVTGALPFSRGARAPVDVVAQSDTWVLLITVADLPEMVRECPTVTGFCVHAMLDRARAFSTSELRDEKLLSLGRLAAGLAHELNNPASAAVRSSRLLDDALRSIESASARVGAAGLTTAQRDVIERVRRRCFARLSGPPLSPVARSDREEAIMEWLAAHQASEDCAAPLTETALTIAQLDELADAVQGDALDASLRWIAAGCLVRTLSSEISMATSRIHGLVGAVKGFTFMDHARDAEPVDIRRGIEDTFTLLGSKLRSSGVEVVIEIPHDLPHPVTVGAELNQVWMNLIDNALDAVADGGTITIAAAQEGSQVAVRVRDSGTGIPADKLGRIFDPFFTTKDVGKGTGLGLDIMRRIVGRLGGEIAVESAPGRTEFRVAIPVVR